MNVAKSPALQIGQIVKYRINPSRDQVIIKKAIIHQIGADYVHLTDLDDITEYLFSEKLPKIKAVRPAWIILL